ncbi:MAG TPA: ABC transporter substrate-binding protein [Chloroflexota bacterium]|jgi:NitT/TauT family transport system substrate-binding protein
MSTSAVFAALAILLALHVACAGPSAQPAAPASAPAPAAASAPSTGPASGAVPAAGAPAPTPGRLTAITISNPSPAVSILPFYAAIDGGFFARQGLDASIVKLAGSAAQAALSKGEIDFMNSPSEAVIGASNGFPFKIVFSAWERAPWTLVGKTEFKTLPDLRDRVVATNRPGTAPYSYLDAALKRAGMTVSDVSILYLTATQDDYAALVAGQIDAGVLSPPFDAQAAEQGFHEVQFLGDLLEIPYIGLATTEGYLQDHPAEVKGAIRALLDAEDWIRAQPADAVALLVKYVEVSPPIAERSYQRMLPLLTKSGETSLDGIRQSLAIQAEITSREIGVDPQSIVEFGPLREVRAAR